LEAKAVYAQWYDTGIITTNGSAVGTGYTPVATGRVLAVRYAKTDYADGVVVTVTVEGTGEAVVTMTAWNASGTVYPRAAVQDAAGAGAVYIASGQAIREPVAISNDRVKFAIASAGNAHTGRFYVLIGG
jgi:hypothetical protein